MRLRIVSLFFVMTGLGVGSCSGTHDSVPERALPSASVAARPTSGVNVPALLVLSVDELSQRVGPALPVPADFVDPTMGQLMRLDEVPDSTALFRAQGLAMVASYNYSTRKLSDLLLLGTNENDLMRQAQLRLGATSYLVLPVFQEQYPTKLMGLRVLATTLNQ